MRYIWEAVDFTGDNTAIGMVVAKPGTDEVWIIGYNAGTRREEARYTLISTNDGMVSGFVTAEEMAEQLNAGGKVPLYQRHSFRFPAKDRSAVLIPETPFQKATREQADA